MEIAGHELSLDGKKIWFDLQHAKGANILPGWC